MTSSLYEDPKEEEWKDKVDKLDDYLNSFVPEEKPPVEWVLPHGPHSGRCEALFEIGYGSIYVNSELDYTLFGSVPGVFVDAMRAWEENNFVVPF